MSKSVSLGEHQLSPAAFRTPALIVLVLSARCLMPSSYLPSVYQQGTSGNLQFQQPMTKPVVWLKTGSWEFLGV